MAFKVLIFFGLMALALGFTLPKGQEFAESYAVVEPEWEYAEEMPVQDDEVLVRMTRSPQERLQASYGYDTQSGRSATVDYIRPINKNWEVYAGAARNFRYNDNSGHVGLRYNF